MDLHDTGYAPCRVAVARDKEVACAAAAPVSPARLVARAAEQIRDARLRSRRPASVDATQVRLRDRPLVLLGFALGRRGVELVSIDIMAVIAALHTITTEPLTIERCVQLAGADRADIMLTLHALEHKVVVCDDFRDDPATCTTSGFVCSGSLS